MTGCSGAGYGLWSNLIPYSCIKRNVCHCTLSFVSFELDYQLKAVEQTI